ncbi:hypothetical protein WJX72_002786 [[Myrmecia] bisecta]|uniref:B9 domain-containing protein 2 n=1 Tax=[Myrmecia] bisecta TaxID=41462 RepID=A0AAW1QPI7_9CHLO
MHPGSSQPVAGLLVVGEIIGCSGFPNRSASCSWQVAYDRNSWQLLSRAEQGVTHTSHPLLDEDDLTVWDHPVHLHLQTTTIQAWPRIVLKVFCSDERMGRSQLAAYSLCSIPNTAGAHTMTVPAWRASDAHSQSKDQLAGFFTNMLLPRLEDEAFILDPTLRHTHRSQTCALGCIHLRLHVLLQNFESIHIHVGGLSICWDNERRRASVQKALQRSSDRSAAKALAQEETSVGLSLVHQGRDARFADIEQSQNAQRRGLQPPSSPSPPQQTPGKARAHRQTTYAGDGLNQDKASSEPAGRQRRLDELHREREERNADQPRFTQYGSSTETSDQRIPETPAGTRAGHGPL